MREALQVFRSLMDADSADYTDLVPPNMRRLSLKASAAQSSEAEDSPTTPAGPKGANPLSMPRHNAFCHQAEHAAGHQLSAGMHRMQCQTCTGKWACLLLTSQAGSLLGLSCTAVCRKAQACCWRWNHGGQGWQAGAEGIIGWAEFSTCQATTTTLASMGRF